MVKATVLYGRPTDLEAFERHYAGTHLALAARIPHVIKAEVARVVGTPDGSTPPYYRIAELWFESMEQLQGGLGSPEGQAAVADLPNFATGGVTILISETA
jgi:uncharacterized protein (TIGR02118 family)